MRVTTTVCPGAEGVPGELAVTVTWYGVGLPGGGVLPPPPPLLTPEHAKNASMEQIASAINIGTRRLAL